MATKEFEAGYDYARTMQGQKGFDDFVNIDKMVQSSCSIPDADYRALVDDGVVEPDAREYWEGYNCYGEECLAQAVFAANERMFGPLINKGSFELLDLDGDTVRETFHGKGSTTEAERERFKALVEKIWRGVY